MDSMQALIVMVSGAVSRATIPDGSNERVLLAMVPRAVRRYPVNVRIPNAFNCTKRSRVTLQPGNHSSQHEFKVHWTAADTISGISKRIIP